MVRFNDENFKLKHTGPGWGPQCAVVGSLGDFWGLQRLVHEIHLKMLTSFQFQVIRILHLLFLNALSLVLETLFSQKTCRLTAQKISKAPLALCPKPYEQLELWGGPNHSLFSR